MGAGSVISAMGGIQDMDRMGGFRKAMPFTFVTFTFGALALAGFPLTLGLLLEGRDPRLHDRPRRLVRGPRDRRLRRRGADRLLRVPDGLPRLLRERRSRRRASSSRGTSPTTSRRTRPRARPRTPTSASPARSTTIAEREWPMKAAMAPLAVLALIAGVVQVPGVDDVIEKFLEPTFADSTVHEPVPERRRRVGRARGRRPDLDRRHQRSPTSSTCAAAASRSSCATASRACTPSSSTSGTSTSCTTPIFVRPVAAVGRVRPAT